MDPIALYAGLAVPITVLADGAGWSHMEGPWGWGMTIFGSLMMAAFVVLLLWIVRSLTGHDGSADKIEPSALDILDQRFAGGEIDRDEYLQRRSDLKGGS